MNKQEQIEKLAGMIRNLHNNQCPSEEIAEIAIIMALRWNQDTKDAATDMYEILVNIQDQEYFEYVDNGAMYNDVRKALLKARGKA